MPPNRRNKAKKHGSIDTKRVADDDDDVFEPDDKPIKKPFKRFKAANATRQNLRSSGQTSATNTIDSKHVDMKRKNSSSPEMKSKPSASNPVDSDQVNFSFDFFEEEKKIEQNKLLIFGHANVLPSTDQESDISMDIGPPSQMHHTRSKDTEADEPKAKRQKSCDKSPSENGSASKKSTPTVSDEPIEEKDSNAKVT